MSSLTVICGPMYSGKSEELIRLLRRAAIGNKTTVLLRPDIDHRYHKKDLVSHAGITHKAHPIEPVAEQIFANGQFFDVVGVDEIQFFSMHEGNTVEEMITWLLDMGKEIVVSGLDMTFRREPFGCIPNLMAMADKVLKLDAVCHKCGGTANLTQRLVDGKPASFDGPTIKVGGTESYEARCRICFETGS